MIQQRGARWRVVVQGRRDELTGRRRQLSGSTSTEREAVALERTLRLQAERGLNGRMTLAELVGEWWASGPRLAPTTLANYRSNVDVHILPMLGDRRLEEIRPRLISQFLQHLVTKGLSAGTARKVRTVLSAAMSYAVAMEYVESNPVMKVPPPEQDDSAGRTAPTVTDTARILLAAEWIDPDFHTFLWVAAEEGGRRGEVLALRWRDIDFDNNQITIRAVISAGIDGVHVRNRTKTNRVRTLAISAGTAEHLLVHRHTAQERLIAVDGAEIQPDDYVFSGGLGSRRTLIDGQPWRPDSTTRRFRRVKERAGVGADITLHGLRHTMITELLHAGVDPRTVMGRAGHASTVTTLGVYAKVRPPVDSLAADAWGQRLSREISDLRDAASRAG